MVNQIINSYWLLASLLIIPIIIAFLKKDKVSVLLFTISYYFTSLIGRLLKQIIAVPRPFVNNPRVLDLASNIPTGYSFPSLHAALITIFAWSLATIIPQLSWLGFGIALFIGFSRVYLGVHYYIDIVAGFLLGTGIFWAVYILFNQEKILLKDSDPNVRRKLFHLIYGITLAGLIHYGFINIYHLGLTAVVFGAFVLGSKFFKSKKITYLILYFERQKKPKYLGLGPFLFLVSAFLTALLFKQPIAVAAILNLAIGDSINVLLGHFGQNNGWQGKKRLEASFTAAIATVMVALYFVNPYQAVAGSLVTLVLEYTEPEISGMKIDDNLLIPIISGLAMSLV